jgi:adenylosuccinate lyase
MARDTAYRVVQSHAMQAWKTSDSFEELVRSDTRITALLKPEQLDKIFNPASHFKNIDRIFRSAGL